MTDPNQPTAPEDAVSVVRSEERLLVSRETRATERVRFRKRVVSEDVTRTVTVRREELVVDREPVEAGDVVDGHEPATHDELELVLHEERVEVRTVVVPVERVRVRVVRVDGERTVTEVLRREQVTVTTDGPEADEAHPPTG